MIEIMTQLKLIISGGGTGGHIFPAIAIAKSIERKIENVEILFIGSMDRMEMQKVPEAGYNIKGLWISGLQRNFSFRNLLFPFKLITSLVKANRILRNFKPDIVILGHADRVLNSTLSKMKDINKDVVFSQWFLDPLSKYGPDHKSNSRRILDKKEFLNTTFLTTDPSALSINIPNSYFMPNPADKSFETLNNFHKSCNVDVFFALSHGVHRGVLKSGKTDDRVNFVNKIDCIHLTL